MLKAKQVWWQGSLPHALPFQFHLKWPDTKGFQMCGNEP